MEDLFFITVDFNGASLGILSLQYKKGRKRKREQKGRWKSRSTTSTNRGESLDCRGGRTFVP